MPPESGGICGRLTSDLPLGYLQGGWLAWGGRPPPRSCRSAGKSRGLCQGGRGEHNAMFVHIPARREAKTLVESPLIGPSRGSLACLMVLCPSPCHILPLERCETKHGAVMCREKASPEPLACSPGAAGASSSEQRGSDPSSTTTTPRFRQALRAPGGRSAGAPWQAGSSLFWTPRWAQRAETDWGLGIISARLVRRCSGASAREGRQAIEGRRRGGEVLGTRLILCLVRFTNPPT